MQHASIVAFLSGLLSPEDLACEIADEVAAFQASLRATAQASIVVSDGPLFVVTRDGARRLLRAVAAKKLPFLAANYLADCIVMNDDFEFEDDAVREAIFFIEDDTGRFATKDDDWHPSQADVLSALTLLD